MHTVLTTRDIFTVLNNPHIRSPVSDGQGQYSNQVITTARGTFMISVQEMSSIYPYISLRQMTCTCRERMSRYVLSISGALVWQLDLTGLWKMEMWHHTNLQWTYQSFSQDGNATSLSFFICSKFTRTLRRSWRQWTQIRIQSMFFIKQSFFPPYSVFLFWTEVLCHIFKTIALNVFFYYMIMCTN